MHASKDSMWQRILKILTFWSGTKQALSEEKEHLAAGSGSSGEKIPMPSDIYDTGLNGFKFYQNINVVILNCTVLRTTMFSSICV